MASLVVLSSAVAISPKKDRIIMAFYAIPCKQTEKIIKKPFLEEAIEREIVSEEELYEIYSVKMNRSKSGYVIETGSFIAFVYRSEEDFCEVLIETLEDLVDQSEAPALIAKIDMKVTTGFQLGIDADIVRMWSAKKKFGDITVYRSTKMELPLLEEKAGKKNLTTRKSLLPPKH